MLLLLPMESIHTLNAIELKSNFCLWTSISGKVPIKAIHRIVVYYTSFWEFKVEPFSSCGNQFSVSAHCTMRNCVIIGLWCNIVYYGCSYYETTECIFCNIVVFINFNICIILSPKNIVWFHFNFNSHIIHLCQVIWWKLSSGYI